MRRALTLFASLLILWVMVAQLNHALSGWNVYLFVGSLFVTYAALTQPLRAGLAAAILGGLLCDANTPVIFGTHALLFAAAHRMVFHMRDRVPREDATGRTAVALLTNVVLFLALTLTQLGRTSGATLWGRLLADLFVSEVFLALVAPWFFAVQSRVLQLARVERDVLG